jgi:NAD(P)H dehydrogenase (quinone)
MSKQVCVVFHSGYGHTERQAAAVAEGAGSVDGVNCELIPVGDLEADAPAWDKLDSADAIVMGCPTYMGSASAGLKQFMEQSSGRWQALQWADKLAAGFTNSGSQNGDKQNTLVQLATFAAQHGMVWINLNQPPGNNSSTGSEDDLNRLGASLGAMAQSDIDVGPDQGPTEADLASARGLGQRVAECALRWG